MFDSIRTSGAHGALAFTALLCWAVYKFIAGGQPASLAYLLQVAILVTLTAVLPYVFARLLARIAGGARTAVQLLAPSLFACLGYATFFVVFIAPYAPDVPALAVIPRGLLPGAIITALLLLQRAPAQDESRLVAA